jgi:exopolysaccharide biosynthesis polyprenyl glycosylphosphotransferase
MLAGIGPAARTLSSSGVVPERFDNGAQPMSSVADKTTFGVFEPECFSWNSNLKGFRKIERLITGAEICSDMLTSAFGLFLAYRLYLFFDLGKHVYYRPDIILVGAGSFGALFVLMLHIQGGYTNASGLLRVRETERVLRSSFYDFGLLFAVMFFSGELISRWLIMIAFVFVPLLVIVEKQIYFLIIHALHSHGLGVQKVLIYGAGSIGRRVFSSLANSPKLGFVPVALVDDRSTMIGSEVYASGYRHTPSIPIVQGPVTCELIEKLNADIVVIAISALDAESFEAVAAATAKSGIRLSYIRGALFSASPWVDYVDVDGLMLASVGTPPSSLLYTLGKRIFDLTVACLLTLFCLPVMVGIGLAIRLDSRGPVLFKQMRIGRHGKSFNMFKFRTMQVDAPAYDYSPKELSDSRITRVGRYLRKTSLDELAQLFNVINGDMSLVGPRPEMPFIVQQYGPRERQRLAVIPGITGLWQLSAGRAFLIHENLQYDFYYIRNRNFFMDMAILLHTAVFAMRGV